MLRPVSKWLSRGLAAGLAGITVLLALLFWRLASAGLSLSFVTPYVNAALDDALPGHEIQVGSTELSWRGLDRPLGVLARDVRIAPAGGATAASIPQLQLDFALRPLLRGELRLTRAEAIGARLHLSRNAEGELRLAVSGGGGAEGAPAPEDTGTAAPATPSGVEAEEALLARLAAQLLGEAPDAAGAGALADLQAVGVIQSRLVIDDAITGRSWQARDVRLAAERGPAGIELRGSMVLGLDERRSLPLSVVAFHRLHSDAADIRISGGPVYPAELALGAGAPWLEALDAPLMVEIGFRFDGNRLPASIEGRISGPLGRLRLPDLLAEPLPLSDLEMRFRLNPQAQRLDVDRLQANLAGAAFSGAGSLSWTGEPMALLSGEGGQEPARLSALAWEGRLEPLGEIRLQEDGRVHVGRPGEGGGEDGGTAPPRLPAAGPGVALDAPLTFRAEYSPAAMPVVPATERPGGFVLTAEIGTQAARLFLPGTYPRPLALADLALALRHDPTEDRLEIRQADLVVDGLPAALQGQILLAPPGRPGPGWQHLVLDGSFGSLDVPLLLRLWPAEFATPVREWFAANLHEAELQEPRLALDLGAAVLETGHLPQGSVELDFGIAGASVSYLAPMAPLQQVAAQARLTQDEFRMSGVTGALDGVEVDQGSLVVAGLQDELPRMEIGFRARGSIAALLRVVDQKPLELPRRIDLDPASVGGSAALEVSLAFPLRAALQVEDVAYGVSGPLSGLELQDVIGDIDLSRGALQLRAGRDGLEAKGQAQLAGVPARVEWEQPLRAGASPRYRVRARLDEQQRQRLGLDVAPFLTGPLEADFRFVQSDDGGWQMGASLDLTDAQLLVPTLHAEKPRGVPGSAALRGEIGDDGFRSLSLDNLVAPGLGIEAQLDFTDGAVSRIDVRRLELGETALSGWAQVKPDGVWTALLQGARADLRPWLDDLADGGSGLSGPAAERGGIDTDLVLNVAHAVIDDDFQVTDLAAEISLRDGRMDRLQAQAGLPVGPEPETGGTIRLRVARDGDSLRFALDSDNAGQTLRTIGFGKLSGGSLVAVGSAPAGMPGWLTARAVVQGGRIVDVPRLEELIHPPGRDPGAPGEGSGATILPGASGGSAAARPAGGRGVRMDVAEMDLQLLGRTLLVHSLRARGPEIGLTMQGEIGLQAGLVAMTGTFVPAYALNSMFGRIPIIGDLLIGREGEGLIGFTFRVAGPVDDPDIDVNPLSGLAPGFLRRLFEFTPPDLSASGG